MVFYTRVHLYSNGGYSYRNTIKGAIAQGLGAGKYGTVDSSDSSFDALRDCFIVPDTGTKLKLPDNVL